MSYRANKTNPNDDSFKASMLSVGGTKQLRHYYNDYKNDCQQFGFIPISFCGWIVDMAINGYLHTKERRKDKS